MKAPAPASGRIELLTPGRKRLVRLASRLLPEWTARQAEALFLKPPRKRGRAAEVLDAWGRRDDIELGGARLALWQLGVPDAPRVLLVHGWGGYGAQLAGFVPGLLARGFGVVLFDHPGHGESEGRAGSLPEFMASLDVVVRHVGAPAAIVAHSLGAAASLHALRERRFDCPRLVLIGAPGSFELHLKTLSRRVGLGRDAHSSLKGRHERRYVPVADLDRLKDLPIDHTAVLMVHDRDDREVDIVHLDTLHRAWPGSHVLVTRGWGHNKVLRAPEVLAAACDFVGGAAAACGPAS